MTYSKHTWVNGSVPALDETNLNEVEQGIYDAHEMATGRSAEIVVAAGDSSARSRRQADYVCDGTADQVEIQAALDEHVSSNDYPGTFHFAPGLYNISAPIEWPDKYGITLEGEWGRRADMYPTPTADQDLSGGTSFCLTNNADCSMFEFPDTNRHLKYCQVRNILLVGDKTNQTPGATSHCFDVKGSFSDSVFNQVVIIGFLGDAWHFDLTAAAASECWHIVISDTWLEHCRYGFYQNGSASAHRITKLNLDNIHFMANSRDIYTTYCGSTYGGIRVTGCSIKSGVYHGSYTDGMVYIGNLFMNEADSAAVIQFTGNTRSLITGNMLRMAAGQLLFNGANAQDILFESNSIYQSGAGAAAPVVKHANAIFRNNKGFTTENSGTATLVNGTTSIAVTHGLAVTPAAGDIVVTPIETWGSMTQFYIDTYTSTQFTIHADQNPGQDVDIAWKAMVL